MAKVTYVEKQQIIIAAKELCYTDDIIRRLEKETDTNVMARIMKEARHKSDENK